MIKRSAGITTGYGYLAGSGYEGKTKELDKTVLKIAKLMEKTFKSDVEIRYNSDRESGGAFIKDDNYSYQIGMGASLQSSKFLSMTTEEKIKITAKEFRDLPNDVILYSVVLNDSLRNDVNKKLFNKNFKTIKGAFNWLNKNMNASAVKEYLGKINGSRTAADWILTDDDSSQYVKKIGYGTGDTYALIETSMINPEIPEYEVYENTICVSDYIKPEKDGELQNILDSFSYKSVDAVKQIYGAAAMQVIAECIFEYFGSAEANQIFKGSEEKCREFIQEYIRSENPL